MRKATMEHLPLELVSRIIRLTSEADSDPNATKPSKPRQAWSLALVAKQRRDFIESRTFDTIAVKSSVENTYRTVVPCLRYGKLVAIRDRVVVLGRCWCWDRHSRECFQETVNNYNWIYTPFSALLYFYFACLSSHVILVFLPQSVCL
jgi:hypothetical protein